MKYLNVTKKKIPYTHYTKYTLLELFEAYKPGFNPRQNIVSRKKPNRITLLMNRRGGGGCSDV